MLLFFQSHLSGSRSGIDNIFIRVDNVKFKLGLSDPFDIETTNIE